MASNVKTRKFVVATSFSRGEQWLDKILVIQPLRTEVVSTSLGETEAPICRVIEVGDDGEPIDHGENPIFWAVVKGQLGQATEESPLVAGRLVKVGNAYRLDGLSEAEQDLVDKALDQLDEAAA
jgi:hypothetical protein